MKLSTPVCKLVGVGEKYLKKLENLGIKTVEDLLFYFPRKYNDFSQIIPISQIKPEDIVTIYGNIWDIKNQRTYKKKMMITTATIADKSGTISAIWYRQPYLTGSLKPGYEVIFSGKAEEEKGKLILQSPTYEVVKSVQNVDKKETCDTGACPGFSGDTCDTFDTSVLTHVGRIVPVYSETERLTSRWLRFKIKPLLFFVDQIEDYLPEKIKKSQNLLDLSKAVEQIHFPDNNRKLQAAKVRLSFDELFLIQINNLKQKAEWQKGRSQAVSFQEDLTKKFVRSLPFKLTNDQRKTAWEILCSIKNTKPSNRLLEGDVGSGKTVVAVIAIISVVKSDLQVAYMAPTEILASQHFEKISSYLEPFGIKIAFLLGSTSKSKKKKIIQDTKSGKIDLVIGTHALIQEDVKYKNLGLAIIDEQHRFGIEQRAILRQASSSGYIPHLLTMSATPIPRTLALALYGDLDLSIISELPPGRPKIITRLVKPQQRKKAYDFIKDQISKGRQAFVVCPLIEESDYLGVKSTKQEYKKLSDQIFPDLKIGILHGKLKSKDKERVMKEFACGKLDVLVSTSVVEVGIDVPNAAVMMVEGSERFGLAQLHQFRGRVGRGKHQSYCLLFCESGARKTFARLQALIKSDDGFRLAEADLKIRGPGEIYGRRQHGFPDLKMASLSDIDLIKKAKEEAEKLLEEDSQLSFYPKLLKEIDKFITTRHLE